MKHLSEEELIEHSFGQSEAAVAAHLRGCARCASAFADLESDLAAIRPVEPPARDEAWARRVWSALDPLLVPYAARKSFWLRRGLWQAAAYAAICALLAGAAFYAGRQWEHRQAQPPVASRPAPPPPPAAAPQPRMVVVLLSDHLDRSERLLVELKHADADSEEMASPLRDEARNLLAANRICRQDAGRVADPALRTALDRLDRVLAEVANRQGTLDAASLARLQEEMNVDGLLFQVRVLRSRIPDRRAAGTNRANGGTI